MNQTLCMHNDVRIIFLYDEYTHYMFDVLTIRKMKDRVYVYDVVYDLCMCSYTSSTSKYLRV